MSTKKNEDGLFVLKHSETKAEAGFVEESVPFWLANGWEAVPAEKDEEKQVPALNDPPQDPDPKLKADKDLDLSTDTKKKG